MTVAHSTRTIPLVLVCGLMTAACGEPPGRWSGTGWWPTYAALPEWTLDPVSSGALDETTQPFPALRRVSVSRAGRIAVVQEGIPAVWVYDARGRSLGRAGRSEIMDLRGPNRSRVWTERAGWLPGNRLWIAERGGDVAIFNPELAFSDVWSIGGGATPLAVAETPSGLSAIVVTPGPDRALVRRTRPGGAAELAPLVATDTAVACADLSCQVLVRAAGDTLGFDVVRSDRSGEIGRTRIPRAPDGTRAGQDGPLPHAVRWIFADDEDRTWLGLAEDDSGRGYAMILDASGTPVGRFHLTDGQVGVFVSDGVFWTRRDADGVSWLHRYRFTPPERLDTPGPADGGG